MKKKRKKLLVKCALGVHQEETVLWLLSPVEGVQVVFCKRCGTVLKTIPEISKEQIVFIQEYFAPSSVRSRIWKYIKNIIFVNFVPDSIRRMF